ncbi:protein kinase STUNTED-like isoform X3 [Pyrus x bretschneideri]|uniref:protein kinase STUNTED-like isoform X3 n=1 Tax=Pyrus x bretschneideri TaxID=225117 RepID=UPI00202EC672|nr:protein kinase STUNTED-like isoform X3 [Pyrus x bretschneideri]
MVQEGCGGGHAEVESCGGRSVVVGVKLDSKSRELLTWAMVKVAQPGDRVIALHVPGKNEIVDRDGKSSLLSLVKAFDSVLAVYDGFCNLKQVDLKLKICRGTSIKKILVREANSYTASKVIVGTAQNHHKIRSSTAVAKYCAKKLSKDCGVLAVNNGKVVFNRECSQANYGNPQGSEEHHRNSLLSAFHRSVHKSSKVLNDGGDSVTLKDTYCQVNCQKLEQGLAKVFLECSESVATQKCSVCSGPSVDSSGHQSAEEFSDDGEDKSMAIVPVQKEEALAVSSISMLIRELPEVKPGWPLLRRAVLPERQIPERFMVRTISVVQWAMQLPIRQHSIASNFDERKNSCDSDQPSCLNGESGPIVAVGGKAMIAPPSPDYNSKALPKELEGLHEKYLATCRLFTYQELQSATSYFLADNIIGRGGSSQVYRGCLPDGKELAVKILKPSEDVLKEFVLEIDIITTLNHKNIISLLGFCFEDNNLLLVYDFLSRGSLEENLHGTKKDPLACGWNERYKVAVGVAEALDYLHTGSAQSVIHRDVKSSNILLSDDFEPQLSDFGLAKWVSTSSSHITCSDVAGTFGYLAPEYFMYGKVNDKIDVYAFGVVLLELLSGRRPISSDHPKGHESLVMWAKPILNGGQVSQLLDPHLGNNYDQGPIERMVLAATLCIRHAPRARPQMSFIVKLLQGDADVTKWARLQVHAVEESDVLENETCPHSNLQSHLNLALLDVEDDSLSMSSIEQTVSLEDYLKGRWSRSSSFD